MICCKAALVAVATILFAGSLAEARPRSVPAGAPSVILVREKPAATIRSPVTGEILYRVPRRYVLAGRIPPRRLARSLMLYPQIAVPRRAQRVLVQYSGYGPTVIVQPPDVVRELGRQGYRDIGGLTRRGGNWVGEATGPQGQRQRIIIDRSGRVRGSSPSGGGGGRAPGGGFYGGY